MSWLSVSPRQIRSLYEEFLLKGLVCCVCSASIASALAIVMDLSSVWLSGSGAPLSCRPLSQTDPCGFSSPSLLSSTLTPLLHSYSFPPPLFSSSTLLHSFHPLLPLSSTPLLPSRSSPLLLLSSLGIIERTFHLAFCHGNIILYTKILALTISSSLLPQV